MKFLQYLKFKVFNVGVSTIWEGIRNNAIKTYLIRKKPVLIFIVLLFWIFNRYFLLLRNWVFATNSDFLTSISLPLNVVDLWYFKILILLEIFKISFCNYWNYKFLNQVKNIPVVLPSFPIKFESYLVEGFARYDLTNRVYYFTYTYLNMYLLVWVSVCLCVSNKHKTTKPIGPKFCSE